MMERALKHVASMQYGDALPSELRNEGVVQVFGSNGPTGVHNVANTHGPAIIVGRKGSFGKITWTENPGFCIDTAYYIDSRHTRANMRWLYWALQTLGLDSVSEDTGVPGLSREKAYQAKMWVPPLATQTAIADYLDRKTTAIDALIAKKKLLIEELQKYRKSLVTEAVLRGLQRDAPMKPSPVQEMGDIPAHWNVAKSGRLLRYVKGVPVPREHLAGAGSEDARFLRTGDFWNTKGYEKDKAYVLSGEGLVWKEEGDLAVCFDGFNSEAGKGTVGLAVFEGRGFIDSMLCLIQAKPFVSKRYLEYVHLSTYVEHQIVASARGTTAMHAGYAQYDIQLPVPPLVEQEAIAAHLDEKLATVAPVLVHLQRHIDELKSLRAALISEAVTGRISL